MTSGHDSRPRSAGWSGTTSGTVWALLGAAAFGFAGSLAKPLLDLGWSASALVGLRLGGAALVLLGPALLQLRRGWRPSRPGVVVLVLYGVAATGGAQFCFFNAVQYLPVGTALLLEFSAPVWLIVIFWIRDRRRPPVATLGAALLAMIGMALVLDVGGQTFDLRGVFWGLGAAAGLCGYFLLAEHQDRPAPPVVMAAAGTGIGAVVILLIGALGLLPLRTAAGTVQLGGTTTSWIWPAALLILVPTVLAYVAGIIGIRRLGTSVASFVGLAEVLFSVVFAAILLAQRPSVVQLLGMALVVVGIAVVQQSASRGIHRAHEQTSDETSDETSVPV